MLLPRLLSTFKFILAVATSSVSLAQPPGLPLAAVVAYANEASAIVGNWEWKLDIGPSGGKASMNVSLVEGKLSAVVTAPDGTKLIPKDFTLENNKVTFNLEQKKGLITIKMNYEGELKDDEIRGTFVAIGGPIKKDGSWQATRVKK
jgi:hypothetical protein